MLALVVIAVVLAIASFHLLLMLPLAVGLIVLLVLDAALLYVAIGTVVVMARSSRALGANLGLLVSPPVRPCWTLQSLGRDPRSKTSALDFAREVVAAVVPAGESLVVVAADEPRARVYERLGFQRESGELVLTWARDTR